MDHISPIPFFCRERDFPKKCQEIDKAIRNGDEKYLRAHLRRVKTEKAKKLHDIEEPQETLSTVNWVDDPLQIASMANKKTELEQQEWLSAVNMSGDPLLSVVIAYEKNDLALLLLEEVDDNDLLDANLQRNNALHVAAAVGDGAIGIANALLEKNPKLINEKNEDNETPLLRAALYGRGQMFWELINNGGRDNVNARKKDGSNILHCAIMGNSPRLALEIAVEFPILRITRNEAAVTPLQLVVTIPGAFKSKMQFEPLEAFIYQCIPIGDQGIREPDESLQRKGGGYDEHMSVDIVQDKEDDLPVQSRKSFPPDFSKSLNQLIKLIKSPGRRTNRFIFAILKQSEQECFLHATCITVFSRIQNLTEQKINHTGTMELIECLAGDPTYWEFIGRGKTGELGQRPSFLDEVPDVDDQPRFDSDKLPTEIPDTEDNDDKHQYRNQTNGYMQHDRNTTKSGNKAADVGLQRWNDSPLITGAKLGLYEFVEKILEVYPQSVNLLDAEGKNILQVAIQLGQEKILDTLAWRIAGKNPVLPSRLLYARDEENNTILHYAAEETVKEDEATALQMQHEMQWFEKVQKLVPKDLQYSRNAQEMTAQERFTDKHEKMAKSGKGQLIELGKTCAGLVAAFVFASSFSIPGSSGGETGIFHKVAFKVFIHAFVFGLSCASTALVMFLSLVTSSYRERDFRRSVPTKFFFAGVSFVLALVSLLVAFACNIFLQIYSGKKTGAKDLIPFVCELTIFPALTFLVLLYRGSTFSILPLARQIWS